MEILIELIEQGKALGYAKQDLKDFVKRQQDLLREERAVKRQQEKEQLELKAQLDRERWEAEKRKQEKEQLELQDKKEEISIRSRAMGR